VLTADAPASRSARSLGRSSGRSTSYQGPRSAGAIPAPLSPSIGEHRGAAPADAGEDSPRRAPRPDQVEPAILGRTEHDPVSPSQVRKGLHEPPRRQRRAVAAEDDGGRRPALRQRLEGPEKTLSEIGAALRQLANPFHEPRQRRLAREELRPPGFARGEDRLGARQARGIPEQMETVLEEGPVQIERLDVGHPGNHPGLDIAAPGESRVQHQGGTWRAGAIGRGQFGIHRMWVMASGTSPM